jgi:hypothetical protein
VPRFRSSLTFILTPLLAGACSATALGRFGGDGGYEVIAASLPAGAPATLRAATVSAVASAGKQGRTVHVLVAPGPSGSALTVPFGAEAAGGNLWPSGRNEYAWGESQRSLLAAARTDIEAAFGGIGDPAEELIAADPIGVLGRELRDLETAPSNRPRHGVLNTTGVQTTGGLDMTNPSFWATEGEPERAAERFTGTMPTVPGAVIEIVGIADFAGVKANPDPRFAAAVVTFWQTLCRSLRVASCQIKPFPPTAEVS